MDQISQLTQREKEIITLMKTGLTKTEIAAQLSVKYSTIDSHYKNIYKKLNVNSNVQAIIRITEMKLA